MHDKEAGQSKDPQAARRVEAKQEERAVKKAFVKPSVKRYALPAVTYGSYIW